MPIAGKNVLKTINLPGYPADDPATLTIITNPKATIMDEVDTSDAKIAERQMLAKMITEWNFVDEGGQPLPITPDNIASSLSIFDFDYIHEVLGFNKTLSNQQKKS